MNNTKEWVQSVVPLVVVELCDYAILVKGRRKERKQSKEKDGFGSLSLAT